MNSYTATELRNIFQRPFNRDTWKAILLNLFHADKVRNTSERFTEPDDAEQGYYMGAIDTSDSFRIGLFYYKLSSGSVAHKKVGLRNLVRKFINPTWGEFEAAIVVFDDGNEWRLSFVCDIKEEATAPKRFTFAFGEPGNNYRTAIERFQKLQSQPATFENIREAFSVEALSDDFFDGYRDLYADFVQYITDKRYEKSGSKWIEKDYGHPDSQYESTFGKDDRLVRDYIKKMFGRIVFLYFLQRKGWLNGNCQYMHDLFALSDKKDNFLDGVLEPLFFEVLNTDIPYRSEAAKQLPGSENIPYLNGGLFAQDEIDQLDCKFPQEYFEKLFGFLDSYNFTIDENDTDDAEIGIDPEMLGRIFENLLEDNKDKGAFYTPKEIVRYMCGESLLAYLNKELQTIGIDRLRPLIEKLDCTDLTDREKLDIRKKLFSVKICDPAIGSGAFPMGLVNLLSKLYVAMKHDTDTSKMKRHIMENNIYGVDIDKGAVDIARLRFWLAMIVEEVEPIPLPNLHFKIMQGNSLLESYKGIDLSDLTTTNRISGSLFDSFDVDRENLVADLRRYYGTSDHTKRDQLFTRIIHNVRRQLFDKAIVLPEGMDPSENSDFFLWHTWFADVFANGGFDIVIGNPPYLRIQEIRKVNNEFADCLSEIFKSATGSFDLYITFLEKALDLKKNDGLVCFIMPTKWTNSSFGKGMRQLLIDSKTYPSILDFSQHQVFNASTYTGIQIFRQSNSVQYLELDHELSSEDELNEFLRSVSQSDFTDNWPINSEPWVLANQQVSTILKKLNKQPLRLEDIFDKIFQGIATSKDDVYFLYDCIEKDGLIEGYSKQLERRVVIEQGLIKPLLKGDDVHRYCHLSSDKVVIFPYKISESKATLYTENEIASRFPNGYIYLKECEPILRGREKGRFDNDTWFMFGRQQGITNGKIPKLLAPEISLGGNFSYDINGRYYSTTKVYGYIKKENCEYSYYFLVGLLNSSLFWFFIKNTGYVLRGGYYTFKTNYINPFPVPKYTQEMDKPIKSIEKSVRTMLEAGKENDIDKCNINYQIAQLYGLTPDEIKLIENS